MEISHIPDQSTDGAVVPVRSVALPATPSSAPWLEVEGGPYVCDTIRKTKPFHPALIAPGATLLIAALVTDIVYWFTLSTQWENLSIWLITGGVIIAALSGFALLLDYALKRIAAIAWWRFAGLAVVALLSVLNAFVHSRDAYTAVVPQGLEISGIVTVLLLVVGWRGWNLSARPLTNSTSGSSHSEETRP